MIRVLLVGCFAFYLLFAEAQQSPDYFLQKREISYADGLPDRNVNCGIQDKFGFLWFGTRSGLCYYDGNRFTFLTKKTHGLRETAVLSLAADDSLGLIITYLQPGSSGIPSKKLDVVDIKTKEVKPFASYYPSAPFDESAVDRIIYLKGKPLRFLMDGNKNYRWDFSHPTGFVKKQMQGHSLSIDPRGFRDFSASKISQINEQLNKDLILGDDSVLCMYNVNHQAVVKLDNGYIINYDDLLQKEAFRRYLLTFDGKLKPIDAAGEIATRFSEYAMYLPTRNFNLHNLVISPYGDQETSIMELRDRSIIFYNEYAGFVKIFDEDESVRARSFFRDRLGAWWLCTNVGLYKLTLSKRFFTTSFTRDHKKFAFNNSTRGIYVDDEVSCINLYDSPVIIADQDTLMLHTAENFAVIRDNDLLWLGEYRVMAFDLKSHKFSVKAPSNMSEIWSVFNLEKDQLLIGCTWGIGRYDKLNDHVTKVDYGEYPVANFVYRIFRSAGGQLIAVAENGIYFLSDDAEITDFYSIQATAPNRQLPCTGIHDLYEDKDGIFWIASGYEGLFRWDIRKNDFQQFSIESGFLSTRLYCIQEDDHNNLWLSSDYGIIKFNKTAAKAVTYTIKDGLSENEFNRSSSFKDKNGRIYFGSMNGVSSFHPNDFLEIKGESSCDFPITGFYCLNAKTGLSEDKTEQVLADRAIVLNDHIKSSTIYFSLLDYENRQHLYSYKLEGLDTDWNYTNTDHIQLSNLPYRDFKLRIRAQLDNGDWCSTEHLLLITMEAPFYKKWWFMVLIGILAASATILFVKLRTRVLRRQNIKLEQTIHKRTLELKASLEEQKVMLEEIHHLTGIIVHDIRSPFNKIQTLMNVFEMEHEVSESQGRFMETVKSVIEDSRILTEDLLEINQIEAGTIEEEKTEKIDVRKFLQELLLEFENMAEKKGITLTSNLMLAHETIICHKYTLQRIIENLVSNAIKYTPLRGHVELKAKLEDGRFEFSVKDNGPGISQDEQKLLFKKFGRGSAIPSGHETSTGLGLYIVDIMTKKLEGQISLVSSKGQGAEFKVQIPVKS